MVICSSCQAQNKPTARFCFNCGSPLSQTKTHNLGIVLRGRYQIDNKLAEGGMGAVYLAKDKQLFGRQCVVKEMLPYYTTPAEKAEAESKFQREAELLANLNHPGIPQVYDYFIEQGRYYLVMQFVAGEDLETRLTRLGGPFPETELVTCARQLISVLGYIAQQTPPIIHRDIKPANIILEEATGQVKLVDFGIAKAQLVTGTAKTTPMGTLGYAPPEQYRGQTEPRTDVFALGATLHHLATDRDPRQEAPFDFPPIATINQAVSPAFEAFVAKMLERDVTKRPSATQLKTELDNLGQAAPTSAAPFALRNGVQARTPHELAVACDQHWHDGIFHLYQGHFESWFQTQNRHDLANRAAQIRLANRNKNQALEEFLHTLTPTMPLPILTTDTAPLDFGVVEKGETAAQEIELSNSGRGYLYGSVKSLVDWITVQETAVNCLANDTQKVKVTIQTGSLSEGLQRIPILDITTNGGQDRLAAQILITWQPQLTINPTQIDFGEVLVEEHGKIVQTNCKITNSGGGALSGFVNSPASWLTSSVNQFTLSSQESIPVVFSADTGQIPPLQIQANSIEVQTNVKNAVLPVYIGIKKPWYNANTRLTRWAAYGSLAIVAILSWAYAFSYAAEQIVSQNIPADWSVIAWPLAALLTPFVLFFLAQKLTPDLDEIETYYYRSDLLANAPTPTFDLNQSLTVAIWLLITGLIIGAANEFLQSGSFVGWRLLLGGLAGTGIGAGLTFVGAGWLRPLLGGFSASILALLVAPSTANMPFLWAIMGIILGALVEPIGQPRRLRWLLAHLARPILVLFLATAGAFLAQAAFSRTLIFPWFFYPYYYPSGIVGVFQAFVITATIFAGGALGLWAGSPTSEDWRQTLYNNRLFLILATILALIAFIPVRGILQLFGLNAPWILILAIIFLFAGLTYLPFYHPQMIAPWLDAALDWLKAKFAHINAPAWLMSRLRLSPNFTFQQTFANLDMPLTVAVVSCLLVALPFLVRLVWAMLGFTFTLALIAGAVAFAVMLIRQNS